MAGCLELMAGWLGCWLASRNLLTEQLLTDSWGGGWLAIYSLLVADCLLGCLPADNGPAQPVTTRSQ